MTVDMTASAAEAWTWLIALPWWQSLLLVWMLWDLLFSPDDSSYTKGYRAVARYRRKRRRISS